MQPLLERSITFRLTEEEYQACDAAARRHHLKLSTYIRMKVATGTAMTEEIEQLRLTVIDNLPSPGDAGLAGHSSSAVLELLIIQRQSLSPGVLRAVHAEMNRLGFTPWAPEVAPAPTFA